MYYWAQYILAEKQIYQIVFWFVWDRGKSRQRILKVFVPLSTVIQGGTVGGWGPDAEAKTAESFGTTFNLRRGAIVRHGHLGSPTLTWDSSRCSGSLSQEAQGQLAHPHPRYSILTRFDKRNLEASSFVDRVAQPQCDDEEWGADQWRLLPN